MSPISNGGSSLLRWMLVATDAVTIAATSLIVIIAIRNGLPEVAKLASTMLLVAVAITFLASQRLYRARVCAVRTEEIVRLGRVCIMTGIVGIALDRALGTFTSGREVLIRSALMFMGLVISRGAYRAWIRECRKKGLYSRPVVIVGAAGAEVTNLHRLVSQNPELGYKVQGVIGPSPTIVELDDPPWLGDVHETRKVLYSTRANGALVAASSMAQDDLNTAVRTLLDAGAHVHISSGLSGIDHRRVVSHPLAWEPLLYLEPVSLSGWQMILKRSVDLVLGVVGLIMSVPVIAIAAIAIKIEDGGPIFFSQRRIGRFDQPFTMFKLRTMAQNAEEMLIDLLDQNQRTGPLFKLTDDPRVTRVGRILRAMSIDEIPQLLNVIKGNMSLVGPRPALPHEVAQFDQRLLLRHQVRPGITGLWQVEARDDPSFSSYERFDTYYVENWSVMLDIAVILATIQRVSMRGMRYIFRLLRLRHSTDDDRLTIALD